MRHQFKLLGVLAACVVGTASPVQAQDIQFQGSTKGCFFTSSETSCAPANSSSLMYLSYLNSSFDVTSYEGFAGIGAAPGIPNVNNLGSFSVAGNMASYSGSSFWLDVIFTLPTITSSPSVFSAAVKGSVRSFANGSVSVLFDPSSQVFDFQSGESAGQFVLNVNDVSLTPGTSPVALTGYIEVSSVTATPEPATLALMGTGMLGIIGVGFRRRQQAQAQTT
jgi:hypothetical protein